MHMHYNLCAKSSILNIIRLTSLIAEQINDFGKHLWALPDPERNTSVFLKILYIYIIFYYAGVVAIKLAM